MKVKNTTLFFWLSQKFCSYFTEECQVLGRAFSSILSAKTMPVAINSHRLNSWIISKNVHFNNQGSVGRMFKGAGAKEWEKGGKNPANVWPLPWCVFEACALCPCAASERDSPKDPSVRTDFGLIRPVPAETAPNISSGLPLTVTCGDTQHVPVCGGRRRGPCAGMWIINPGSLDAFSRSLDRSNIMFISTVRFLLGGQKLQSFNIYICLCVWVKHEYFERVCAFTCLSLCLSVWVCACVWISPLLQLIGICAYLFEHNSISKTWKAIWELD